MVANAFSRWGEDFRARQSGTCTGTQLLIILTHRRRPGVRADVTWEDARLQEAGTCVQTPCLPELSILTS